MRIIKLLSCTTALALSATAASAGSFAVKENSASAQGMSFANYTAGANDITHIYNNPAALQRVVGDSFTIGGYAAAILPSADGDIDATGFLPGPAALSGGSVDPGENAFVPAFYIGYRINEKLAIGLSTTSPFGLATEYESGDPTDLATLAATRSELTSIVATPMISYDIANGLTVGGGFSIGYADLKFNNDVIDINGDDIIYGFVIGALVDVTPSTTFGVAWRNGFDLSTDGDANSAVLTGGVDVGASLSAEAPPVFSIGVRQGLTEDLDLLLEGQWQRWSDTDIAKIRLDNGVAIDDTFGYEDAFFVAAGVEYRASDALTLRTGAAWDETPTTNQDRSLRIPDEDRLWLSVGASYALTEHMKLDFAYSYLRTLQDPEVTIDTAANGPGVDGTAEFEADVHILSIGASVDF